MGNYKLVSLGSDCFVRRILTIKGLKASKEEGEKSYPFDLCVTPIKAINDILENNFEDYFNELKFNTSLNMFYNNKYKIYYNHDTDCYNDYDKICSRFSNRITNFNKLKETENFIYFVYNVLPREETDYAAQIKRLGKNLIKIYGANKFKLLVLDTMEILTPEISNDNIVLISVKNPYDNYSKQWWRLKYRSSKEGIEFEDNVYKKIYNEISKKFTPQLYKGIDEGKRLTGQVIIGFTDCPKTMDSQMMNPYNNIFYNCLKDRYPIVVDNDPDFLFYSCFGDNHKNIKNCTKIFFTPETIVPNFNECDYAMGFDDMVFGDRYMRFPLYFLHMKPEHQHRRQLKNNLCKRKFCNFIYSNAKDGEGAILRQEFCKKLSQYKHIDCPGKVLNNMSDAIEPRNGNWGQSKLEFIKNYKFTIAFENNKTYGYTTEKLYHAFEACSIPIYWGNPDVIKDFNPKAFINCNDYKSFDDVINKVIELDNDDKKYMEMLRQPCMNKKYKFDKQKCLSNFLYHIIDKGNNPFVKNPNPNLRNGFCRLSPEKSMPSVDKVSSIVIEKEEIKSCNKKKSISIYSNLKICIYKILYHIAVSKQKRKIYKIKCKELKKQRKVKRI